MAKVDKFAQIALNRINLKKKELCEVTPMQFKLTYFKPSSKKASYIKEKSYEEELAEFKKELNALRVKYKPFLADFTPMKSNTRKQWIQKEFKFRYETKEDHKDFSRVQKGQGNWKIVTIPDYRGPVGRWTGFYRREFICKVKKQPEKRMFLKFLGVDYFANVYLNGRFIGSHEGFFAPFEFDVTEYLKYEEKNVLIVEVKNDAVTTGTEVDNEGKKQKIFGEKIYAATGLGWDDPEMGWHHCPPGAGIYNKVILQQRGKMFIHDIFVRPDIDNSYIEVLIEVNNTEFANTNFDLKLSVYPKNFKDNVSINVPCKSYPAGVGLNYYKVKVPIKDFKLWTTDTPWLYKIRASIVKDNILIDEQECQFGMRKIHMDDNNELKGTLYLNNKPLILRGANDMGHMQQCVCKEDYEQLIDDILIAKLANMNFYRFTQRPVQKEIYEYCDMLGMMNQTDLPFFGYIKRTKFCEAVKQAEEMEKLIRSHPSSIMITFINEPFPISWGDTAHINLLRNEMEEFFEVATKVIKLQNPDRIIKNVEGDYDPPTRYGLSDFHCYNMWYTNHALPIGRLHKGYLPAIKRGWKSGCGEYGTEGLDPIEIIMEDYPQKWVPKTLDEKWDPQNIVRSQTYTMHGDWYEEQYNIKDWIFQSQKHQALATRIMTDAFRRRSDIINSTAIHLLIDAWPSGWMKTLVDYRRKPKPAYFEYKHSLEPLRINLRTDRLKVYSGEQAEIECWLLNDTSYEVKGYRIIATVRTQSHDFQSFEMEARGKAAYPTYTGTISFKVPNVANREKILLDAQLIDEKGNVVSRERLKIEAFKKADNVVKIAAVSPDKETIEMFNRININLNNCKKEMQRPKCVLIDSWNKYEKEKYKILQWVSEGTKAIFLLDKMDSKSLNIKDNSFSVNKIGCKGADATENKGLTFAARNALHPMSSMFLTDDFSYMYDCKEDNIGFITEKYVDSKKIIPILFTYEMPDFGIDVKGVKRKLPVVGVGTFGKGQFILSTLRLDNLLGFNPILDCFIRNIIA